MRQVSNILIPYRFKCIYNDAFVKTMIHSTGEEMSPSMTVMHIVIMTIFWMDLFPAFNTYRRDIRGAVHNFAPPFLEILTIRGSS